jgi:hypothetical protein
MKATKTKQGKRKNPTAKELQERLDELTHRLSLQAEHWRGYAAHLELAFMHTSPEAKSGIISGLRNCAGDLERFLTEQGSRR